MGFMTTPRPRRGRPALGAPRLSRDAVVEAALTLIDRDGVAEVGMRSIARHLSVDAKSLYNHVRDKDDLLDAVTEHLLRSIVVHEPTGDLRADLAGVARAFRTAAQAHPRAATLVLTRQVQSVAALAPTQSILEVLLTAGFPPAEAVHLMRSQLAALIGTLLREFEAAPTFGMTDAEAIARREAGLAACGLPAVESVAADLARFDADAEFEYMIALSISAVEARLPQR
ncbi:TetR/AcrR family transcriptional regulator C-terminal domain-containing protein [Tsukamurella tyrosinosolvens]|uniref:Tetracyclin repressor, C-terminal all-alpha domain n=2 Tax=Tsukamurella tyrosinosolvens TaxID=57704 RepID=A0A1H4X5E2_TSUTY|nr:TetR family transcriptional regulator [Tsukamurella tyrosinosolvens]MCA4995804.1 TetR/AcrR family transcriptional regulator C-terminal domain-containing protein [Tsukamurella tyrosinosolvens]QRY83776.1 TetR/AcrR family transcriptional regulator C-terminal domain-containing protein [Tsukamurella tyrosinosolvens]RDB45853.1 TetR family transcriptional regulator [Tsukamurella tyrosinosolvens]SED00942.1 Tetracyclin repressor, C-terminal all-alpha domain [Tsukamurella tyrosinosolvens]VEH98246.1 T